MKALFALALAFGLSAPAFTRAEETPPAPCRESENARALDFWVGTFEVFIGDVKVGDNHIERVVNGCAIIENWVAASGGEGKSLFYFDAAADTWTQVWVTGNTRALGGLKVKRFLGLGSDGTVQFQSEQAAPGGGTYLDRTTLTPLEGGSFRQLIEISGDGGETWRPTFDAVYRSKGGAPETH